MSGIDNTAEHPRVDWLLGGNPEAIYAQEAAGQRQLLHSDRLPTEAHGDFEALGFTFGEPDPADPLFRPATLPEGWTRQGSDHAMGSYLLDGRGIRRVNIFYKAAFYDRRANMHVMNVGADLAAYAIYGDGEVGGPWEKLTADELAQARKEAERYVQQAAEYPDIYGDRAPRAQAVLDQLNPAGGASNG